jgi:Xaa-Pro dipeptidase
VRSLYRRRDELWDRLVEACRPGNPTSALLDAYEQAGEPLPAMPVAHGLGLGFDPPVVSQNLRSTAESDLLEEGMVLAVTGYVWEPDLGAVFTRDAVVVGADGPEVLTQTPKYSEAAHA